MVGYYLYNSPPQNRGKKGIFQHNIKLNKKVPINKSRTKKKFEFVCSYCGFSASEKQVFTKHLRAHAACYNRSTKRSSKYRFACCLCKFKTNFETDIKDHLEEHEKLLEKMKTDEKFNHKRNVKSSSEPTQAKFESGVIKMKCESTENMKNPAVVHNSQLEVQQTIESKFCCDSCDAVYENLHSLSCHRKYNHKHDLEYSCDVCQKKFGDIIAFSQHKNIHPELQEDNSEV